MSMFETLSNKGQGHKAGFFVIVVMIVGITIAAIYFIATRNNMGVLFSDLTQAEVEKLSDSITELDVPYQVTDSGTTILVPDSNVHSLRMKVMSEGTIVSDAVGFELFDEAEFGMTDFMQKINYQRALQGEISRTINALTEVKHSRVHLVMPEKKLFEDETIVAEAAVHIVLKDKANLHQKQLAGIQRLVASAVPDLNENNVSIIDQKGNMLTRISSDASEQNVSHKLQITSEIEAYLEAKAAKILNKAYGENKAVVSIDVEINMDKITINKEEILSTNSTDPGVRKKKVTKSNNGKSKKGKNSSESYEVEFANGMTKERIIKDSGTVTRITVAVLVPLRDALIGSEKIRELISMAVGLDETRGDKIILQEVNILTEKMKVAAFDNMAIKPSLLNIDGNRYVPIEEQKSISSDAQITTASLTGMNNYTNQYLNEFNKYWQSSNQNEQLRFVALYTFSILLLFGLVLLVSKMIISKNINKKERKYFLSEIRKIVAADNIKRTI